MRVLMPLPNRDFDVTEVAVPWRLLVDAGHEVVFATERAGETPQADPKLLTGVIFGQLGATEEAKKFYRQLTNASAFHDPITWREIQPSDYDGLLLPGGHAPGMKQYLEGKLLQQKVADFWALDRPVAAICHGVIVLARTLDPATGRSVIAGRRTTALPRRMERGAYYLTAWMHGRYYRTYPTYVQDEVTAALTDASQFDAGPRGFARGTAGDDGPAFVVQDGNYLSARWPGDAYLFARRFDTMLTQ